MSISELKTIDWEEARRRVAGLATEAKAASSDERFRELACDVCVALAIVYGEELERTKMWDRIATAIRTAASRSAGRGFDRFISTAMEMVKADASKAAVVADRVPSIVDAGLDQDDADRLYRYMIDHSFAIVMRGRKAWQQRKEDSR